MHVSAIQHTQLVVVLLLLLTVAFGWLGQKLKTPYPIILVLAGLGLSLVPGLPQIALNPDLIFVVILPPLLFSAAFLTSWQDFRYNLVSIAFLAFGLVGFTVVGVALTAHMLLPFFDWRLGLVLGAVACTTDPIAATAIAKRIGLPKRIVDVLEGESLVNDASGLIALEFATALVVRGHIPTWQEGLGRLSYLIAGGVIGGLLIGRVVHLVEKRIDNAPIEITFSLVVPYLAYSGAEAIGSSGVLAAVTAGLYLGHQSSYFFSSRVRVESRAFWRTFTFVLNGVVFLLIGLQLRDILTNIHSVTTSKLLLSAIQFTSAVILLRFLWVFPGAYVAYLVRRRLLKQPEEPPSWRHLVIEGWTGMRGVVALAAAISLPATLQDGTPFPQRGVIITLTFFLICVTLLFQGLTLPALIRKLGLAQSNREDRREQKARKKMLEAALERLTALRSEAGSDEEPVLDDVEKLYQRRLNSVEEALDGDHEESRKRQQFYFQVARELRDVERATALRLRNRNQIDDNVLRTLENELDLLEIRFSSE